jgi:hypothetical protein
MEDNLNIFLNGRRPQVFLKEDDLNNLLKTTTKIMQPKTSKSKTIIFFVNKRQPHLKKKMKTTSKQIYNQN